MEMVLDGFRINAERAIEVAVQRRKREDAEWRATEERLATKVKAAAEERAAETAAKKAAKEKHAKKAATAVGAASKQQEGAIADEQQEGAMAAEQQEGAIADEQSLALTAQPPGK